MTNTARAQRRLIFVFTLTALVFAGTGDAKAKRPSDKEIEAALKTLVQLTRSHDAGSQARKMSSMAVLMVVSDLAKLSAPIGPRSQNPADQQKLEQTIARLEKKGVAVRETLAPMLNEFKRYQCRAMQSQAKMAISSLFVAEESHRAEFDTYSKDTETIGFTPKRTAETYRFEVVKAGATSFLARATGLKGPVKGDVWEITEKGHATNVNDACAQP